MSAIPVQGSIGVPPADQAARLRTLMQPPAASSRASRRTARTIAIASGKGGVGKTSIAVNLAILLARRGRRVTLVDADLGTANVDVMLNTQSRWDLSHVIAGQKKIEEVARELEPGLRIVAGASGLANVADLEPRARAAIVSQLAQLEGSADFLLIDCGAGVSQNVLAFARAAEELLVVATPEPTSLTDAYALIKLLSQAGSPPKIRLVMNQIENCKEGEMVARRICQTAERFLGLRIVVAGQILRDASLPAAIRQRTALVVRYPRSPAAACLTTLADGVVEGCRGEAGRPGFFDRLTSFFC